MAGITERTNGMEGSQAAPQSRLIEHAVMRSIADGVIINDCHSRVILINQAALHLLQLTAEKVLGARVEVVFQPFSLHNNHTLLEALAYLYSDPYAYGPEIPPPQAMLEVNHQVIQAQLTPVLSDQGEFLGIVTVLHNITREVEAERTKNEFISNVSHELRTPLTAIKGYSELMVSGAVGEFNEQQGKFLRIIQRNANDLMSLINDLLDISRAESGRMKLDFNLVYMDQVLNEVAETLRPQCDQKAQQLRIEIDPNIGTVWGNHNRLKQVVNNLATNASRYTPQGGQICLSLTQKDEVLRIEVVDTGIGIPTCDHERIFQRFYRVDHPMVNMAGGTGLGLAIAKMLVEMHGGQIGVQSQPGAGSTFYITLPIYTPPTKDSDGMLGRRVLIIEDDLELAAMITYPLRQHGLEVVTASQGEEALRLAHEHAFDVITLDMSLPDIAGIEVLRQLKENPLTAGIPVIIVSLLEQTDPFHRAAAPPIRPAALDKLIQSIRHMLGPESLEKTG